MTDVEQQLNAMQQTGKVFTGKTASSVRAFYADIHTSFALLLEGFLREYTDTLHNIQEQLYELDASETAVIRENFLLDIASNLKKSKMTTANLTDETNAEIRMIQDIVSIPLIDDRDFMQDVDTANRKVKQSIERLYEFDFQTTSMVTKLEDEANLIKDYLSEMKSLVGDGNISIPSYSANSITQVSIHQQMLMHLFNKTGTPDFMLQLGAAIAESPFLLLSNSISMVKNQFDDTISLTTDYRMRTMKGFLASINPVMSENEFLTHHATIVSSEEIRDYKGEHYGKYLTLADGRIVREYVDDDGNKKFQYVQEIPEERLKPQEKADEKGFWDKVKDVGVKTVDVTAAVGKEAADFLFLDDVNTVLDDEAPFEERVLAGFFLTPFGKLGKGVKLVTKYDNFRVMDKGVISAKKVDGGKVDKGIDNPLLPKEGKRGTFKEIAKQGTAFDNITPHHMPSAAKMKQAGVKRNDGVSMNMEQPHPGVGGRHRETYTYGLSGNKLEEYLNLSYRDALTHDILNARRIYMKDGVYTPEIRAGLLNTIRKNRELYPELFNK